MAPAVTVRLERYLTDPPCDFVPIGSPFMSFFYYEALAKLGRFDLMVGDIRANYGRMLAHGATTCWEMYPGEANRANPTLLTRSHCHAWSAAPGYFLGAYVLGVRPAAPGWTKVLVAPQPCGLRWARGSVPLPGEGSVDVAWVLDDGRMRLEVRAPQAVELDVRLPEEDGGEVSVTRV